MLVVTVDAKERARIMAILLLIQVAATSPFGWIAGPAFDRSTAISPSS